MIEGGPVGHDDYRNLIETDRQLIAAATTLRPVTVLHGLHVEPDDTELALDISPGAAKFDGGNVVDQGSYFAWSAEEEHVVFPSPDGQPRVDSLVIAMRDSQYGSIPVESENGPEWIVVEGTPAASPAPPSDATINTAVGPGAWLRHVNVRIDPSDTVINPANITQAAPRHYPQTVQVFTSSGTWNHPPGLRAVLVEGVAGGGGGGGAAATDGSNRSAGTGGGGGGYFRKLIPAEDLGETETVTIGEGGSGGSGSGDGGAGGATSYGSHATANGGGGGTVSTGSGSVGTTGSAGGSATGGDLNIQGGVGGGAFRKSGADIVISGHGGESVWGSGGIQRMPGTSFFNGNSGSGFGSGGSGGANLTGQSASSGGDGASGAVVVTHIF